MADKINTLIVDDEAPARSILRNYLQSIEEVEVIGECSNGFDALKSIQELKPDLIMLDIQMPKLTGLELLELLDDPPKVIFVTAYDQYAIKAFDANAVDYLLKPFSKERLLAAIKKVASNTISRDRIHGLIAQSADDKEEPLERILVKTGNKIKIIDTTEIDYLQAQDDYVMIFTNGEKHLKQQTMRYFEAHLDKKLFFRSHRSYIVNLTRMASIELFEKDSYILKLKSGDQIPVSRSGYSKLKSKF